MVKVLKNEAQATAPLFSVVIPTRGQPKTLGAALAATLAQEDGGNFEVIVQDNCSGPEISEVVNSFSSERVRYHRSDRVLSMTENWEQGLACAAGDYVTFIGDDCALMPDACRLSEHFVLNTKADIICWTPHEYWWPDTVRSSYRDRLMVFCGPFNSITHSILSADILRSLYKFKISDQSLPMISNSFVSRRVIDTVKDRAGCYFGGAAPDIYSGIANCWATKNFLYAYRPLSIRGLSGQNLTVAYTCADEGGEDVRRQYKQENIVKQRDASPVLGSLFAGSSVLRLAEAMAFAHDDLFPGDFHYRLNPMALVDQVLADAVKTNILYDEHISAAKQIASCNGFSLDGFTLPPRPPQRQQFEPLSTGVTLNKGGQIDRLVIDTRKVGITDILGASRLAYSCMSVV